jgi:diguanylate cyclase (GGDEF)-like protein
MVSKRRLLLSAVCLVECDEATAVRIAERIREKIAQTVLRLEDHETSITASIGLSSLQSDMEKIETVMAQADRALYQAKAAGRNRVEVFRPTNGETLNAE